MILSEQGQIEKLQECSDKNFISPIVITVKQDKSVKLALDSKVLNKAIHKNKYQMPNIDSLIDSISQHINDSNQGDNIYFSTIDLRYAYSQLKLHPDTARHCNFNIICGDATGTYRFKTGFYGLTDMPAEFQKAMDYTLVGLSNTYCFLEGIILVSKDSKEMQLDYVYKCLQKLEADNLRINLSKCHFCGMNWTSEHRNRCPARGKKCNNCGIENHFAKNCRNHKDPNSYPKPKQWVNNVEKDDQVDDVNQISADFDPNLESNY